MATHPSGGQPARRRRGRGALMAAPGAAAGAWLLRRSCGRRTAGQRHHTTGTRWRHPPGFRQCEHTITNIQKSSSRRMGIRGIARQVRTASAQRRFIRSNSSARPSLQRESARSHCSEPWSMRWRSPPSSPPRGPWGLPARGRGHTGGRGDGSSADRCSTGPSRRRPGSTMERPNRWAVHRESVGTPSRRLPAVE